MGTRTLARWSLRNLRALDHGSAPSRAWKILSVESRSGEEFRRVAGDCTLETGKGDCEWAPERKGWDSVPHSDEEMAWS